MKQNLAKILRELVWYFAVLVALNAHWHFMQGGAEFGVWWWVFVVAFAVAVTGAEDRFKSIAKVGNKTYNIQINNAKDAEKVAEAIEKLRLSIRTQDLTRR